MSQNATEDQETEIQDDTCVTHSQSNPTHPSRQYIKRLARLIFLNVAALALCVLQQATQRFELCLVSVMHRRTMVDLRIMSRAHEMSVQASKR